MVEWNDNNDYDGDDDDGVCVHCVDIACRGYRRRKKETRNWHRVCLMVSSVHLCMYSELFYAVAWNSSDMIHYYGAACNATHGIAVTILSICPSIHLCVRCVYCEKTKWCSVDILIPQEMAITLVFRHQHWLVDDAPFPVKYSPKVTHPTSEMPTSTDFRL